MWTLIHNEDNIIQHMLCTRTNQKQVKFDFSLLDEHTPDPAGQMIHFFKINNYVTTKSVTHDLIVLYRPTAHRLKALLLSFQLQTEILMCDVLIKSCSTNYVTFWMTRHV